jgi:predicted GIY-YIG superfamily endonuclease
MLVGSQPDQHAGRYSLGAKTVYQNNQAHAKPFFVFDRLAWQWRKQSVIYLLHFDRPISTLHTCQHYIGWTDNLYERLLAHERGQGARLTQVALERGIGWRVARTWDGDRQFERRLKNRKNARLLCPICQAPPVVVPVELADCHIPF